MPSLNLYFKDMPALTNWFDNLHLQCPKCSEFLFFEASPEIGKVPHAVSCKNKTCGFYPELGCVTSLISGVLEMCGRREGKRLTVVDFDHEEKISMRLRLEMIRELQSSILETAEDLGLEDYVLSMKVHRSDVTSLINKLYFELSR